MQLIFLSVHVVKFCINSAYTTVYPETSLFKLRAHLFDEIFPQFFGDKNEPNHLISVFFCQETNAITNIFLFKKTHNLCTLEVVLICWIGAETIR